MYPTKEKILETPILHPKKVIIAVKAWKRSTKEIRKDGTEEQRFENLKNLIEILSALYETEVSVDYEPNWPSSCYNALSKTITLNGSLSIITALHEFAHHLHGPDELKACRWSVWLFKKTFPLAFEKLQWRGHLLTR